MTRIRTFGRLVPLLLVTALLFSGCEALSSPQNTFNPAGQPAQDQRWQFLFVMWPALVIGVLVMAACVILPLRYRRKKGDPGLPKQIHGNTPLELGWTIAPAILLAVIAVPTVAGIQDIGRQPRDDALRIHVESIQWAWLFTYTDLKDADGTELTTDNEIRIPVGREIGFEVTSSDVNHSFWIPKLAGKIDAIRNHPNHLWLKASEPGTYEGQCAEFCGIGHPQMRLRVVALPQEEFDAWMAEQGVTEQPRDEEDDDPGVDEGESPAGIVPSGE
jgi:cytochrome c oxidase subunit 2